MAIDEVTEQMSAASVSQVGRLRHASPQVGVSSVGDTQYDDTSAGSQRAGGEGGEGGDARGVRVEPPSDKLGPLGVVLNEGLSAQASQGAGESQGEARGQAKIELTKRMRAGRSDKLVNESMPTRAGLLSRFMGEGSLQHLRPAVASFAGGVIGIFSYLALHSTSDEPLGEKPRKTIVHQAEVASPPQSSSLVVAQEETHGESIVVDEESASSGDALSLVLSGRCREAALIYQALAEQSPDVEMKTKWQRFSSAAFHKCGGATDVIAGDSDE